VPDTYPPKAKLHYGRAAEVHYSKRAALDQSLPGTPGTARLRRDGLLIMAAGALATPRLLLMSGGGSRGREAEIFLDQSPQTFAIDNPRVGVGVFDHVMSMVIYGYDWQIPYESYNYGDYAGNEYGLETYLDTRSGPYAQYQPVSILNYRYNSDVPNVEVFINPNGAGTPEGPYYGPNTLSAFAMLLNHKARGLITLDENGNVMPRISTCLPTPRKGRRISSLWRKPFTTSYSSSKPTREWISYSAPEARSSPI
jgi:hypothetical protein